MTRHVDFSRQAEAYDKRHGALLAADVVQRLIASAGLRSGARLLEVAGGTGRVSVAFARAGCRVTATDIARPMLEGLLRKGQGLHIAAVIAEGAHLPLPAHSFEGVLLARVLYLLPDWQDVLTEIVRALRPGGVLLHEWGNGADDEEWVKIREKARTLFEGAGVANPFHPGVRSEQDVERFLRDRGLTLIDTLALPGDVMMTLADFLNRIVDGQCSYTWDVPKDVLGPCLAELREWTTGRFTLDRPLPIPRDISWKVYRTQS